MAAASCITQRLWEGGDIGGKSPAGHVRKRGGSAPAGHDLRQQSPSLKLDIAQGTLWHPLGARPNKWLTSKLTCAGLLVQLGGVPPTR